MEALQYNPRWASANPSGPPIQGFRKGLQSLWRFMQYNPIYTGVIMYALFISIRHLRMVGKQRGPFVWQVQGVSPTHKGSCFCSAKDDFCLCGPSVAVDAILEYSETKEGPVTALVFIKRRDRSITACVGGFVQLGETTEEALQREVQEEIGTNTLHSVRLIGVYSHPDRDDRRHTISAAYVGRVYGRLKAGDDAKSISVIPLKVMNVELIKLGFDHGDILRSYWYDRNQSRTVLAPKRGTSTCPAPYPVDS